MMNQDNEKEETDNNSECGEDYITMEGEKPPDEDYEVPDAAHEAANNPPAPVLEERNPADSDQDYEVPGQELEPDQPENCEEPQTVKQAEDQHYESRCAVMLELEVFISNNTEERSLSTLTPIYIYIYIIYTLPRSLHLIGIN